MVRGGFCPLATANAVSEPSAASARGRSRRRKRAMDGSPDGMICGAENVQPTGPDGYETSRPELVWSPGAADRAVQKFRLVPLTLLRKKALTGYGIGELELTSLVQEL